MSTIVCFRAPFPGMGLICIVLLVLSISVSLAESLSVLLANDAEAATGSLLTRDEVPDGSQWVFQDDFPLVPICMVMGDNSTGDCPDVMDLFLKCSSEQCTKSLFGGCMETAVLTDEACICQHYSSNTCVHSCPGEVKRHQYSDWLNVVCAHLPGWTGLSSDWNVLSSPLEVLDVGSIEWDHKSGYEQYLESPTYTYTYRPPLCANEHCSAFDNCLANGSVVSATDMDGGFDNNTLYLDQSCFCTHTFDDFPYVCTGCDSDYDRTALLGWYNATCSNATGFPNMPADWASQLLFFTDNNIIQSNFSWPKCLGEAACTPGLNDTEVSCTSTRCQMDDTGNCTATLSVDRSCFCQDLSYDISCSGSCSLSWERKEKLQWLNQTCSSAPSWAGLPSNWTSLLNIQEDELLPWHWGVQIIESSTNITDSTGAPHSQHICPSTAAKLGAYAAVNVAIAFLVPILGRRTVINRLTFGLCGKPWSRMWPLTGAISNGLQLGSNLINAYYVKSVPGFEKVPIRELTLLWCTRPRLAWLIVALLPIQANEAMYFSVVASTLSAEIILQMLGSVYMGTAANYGRRQHFYIAGHLAKAPDGTNAQIMYAGALLWLVVIGYAILRAASSVLSVNDHIRSLKRKVAGPVRLSARRAKAMQRRANAIPERSKRRNGLLIEQYAYTRNSGESWLRELDEAFSSLTTADQLLDQRWRELGHEWRFMNKHMVEDPKTLEKAEKEVRRHDKELQLDQSQTRRSILDAKKRKAMETIDHIENSYYELPLAKRNELGEHYTRISSSLAASIGERSINTSLARIGVWREDLEAHGAGAADFDYQKATKKLFTHLKYNWSSLAKDESAVLKETQEIAAQWNKIYQKRVAERDSAETKKLRALRSIAQQTLGAMFGCWVAQV